MVETRLLKAALACALVLSGLASLQVDAHRGSGSPDWDLGSPRALTAFDNPTAPPAGGLCGAPYPCSPGLGTLGQPAAVFYPGTGTGPTGGLAVPPGALNADNTAFAPACTSSPQCVPQPPAWQASPWFGTPPPSATGCGGPCGGTSPWWTTNTVPFGYPLPDPYRLPNPCMPSPTTDLLLEGEYIVAGTSQVLPYYGDASEYPVIRPTQWSPIESFANLQASGGVAVGSIADTPYNGPAGTRFHNPFSTSPGATGDGRFHLSNQSVAQSVFDLAGQPNALFLSNGDPKDAEGAPDSRFAELGNDGYVLGRFEQPVFDGNGYDLRVNLAQRVPFGAACVYGATAPQGPFTLVHSLFADDTACDRTLRTTSYCPPLVANPPCPPGDACMSLDLSFYYTPLRTLRGEPNPGRMDYVLVVNSFQHTPYLRSNFTAEHWKGAPWTPPGLVPLRQDAMFYLNDTSVRFGYPMRYGPETCPIPYRYDPIPPGIDLDVQCPYPDPTRMDPDPVSEWDWDFSSDPYSLDRVPPPRPPAASPLQPFSPSPLDRRDDLRLYGPTDHNATHRFLSPGIFQACLSVHTLDEPPFVFRQSDPPASDPAPLTPYLGGAHTGLNPPDMHCKPLTVHNVAVTPMFAWQGALHDRFRVSFYDLSEDKDWLMPPMPRPAALPPGTEGEYGPCIFKDAVPGALPPHAYLPCNLPTKFFRYDGCCACPDCPPDGIQLRTWDFTSDGVVDHTWHYRARTGHAQFCTSAYTDIECPWYGPHPLNPMPANPFWIDPEPYPAEPGNCHAAPGGVEGSWIWGPGIPPGTKVVRYLPESPTNPSDLFELDQPVFADFPYGLNATDPFVLACPYDMLIDAPAHPYPRPGEYNATLRACDHDWVVATSPPLWGSQAWPAPAQRQWSLHGDPYGAAAGVAPDPSPFTTMANGTIPPGTPLPDGFHNQHACQSVRLPVRIPNLPPHLSVPPTIVVAPHHTIAFRAVAWDSDPGQRLTLRPCPGLLLLDGMAFAPVVVEGNRAEQAVQTDPLDLPVGQYGPFCFEVCDEPDDVPAGTAPVACVHAVMMAWVSGVGMDTDTDGVSDLADNCPGVPNQGQADGDHDGVGDACQGMALSFEVPPPRLRQDPETVDHDGDGVADVADNCPSLANRGQEDGDWDAVGDPCDQDEDGDGVGNGSDNCPTVPNPLQEDANRDGLGSACAGAETAPGILDRPKAADLPLAHEGEAARIAVGMGLGLATMAAVLVAALALTLRRRDGERP